MPPDRPDTRAPGARHDCSLPQWAVDKMTRLRGRRYAYDPLDPRRTALVVIDLMQTYVLGTPCAAAIVAPVDRLAASLRAAGGVVAWVHPSALSPQDPGLTRLWGAARVRVLAAEMAKGADGVTLADGLTPEPDDIVVRKTGASAFFPGPCPLPEMLTARGIDTVLITGVLTNICCESSARDAATSGFRVVMVADANAARSDEEHRVALYNVLRNFGDVRMTDDTIAALGR